MDAIIWSSVSVGLYLFFRAIAARVNNPLVNPLLLAMCVMFILIGMKFTTLENFTHSTAVIAWLLKPAVVTFAWPLYSLRHAIKRRFIPILLTCSVACIISVLTAYNIGHWMHVEPRVMHSIELRSITTPFALTLSDKWNAIGSVAAAIVVFTGIFGGIVGWPIIRAFRRGGSHIVCEAEGLVMGSCAHTMGVVTSVERGETTGAFATIGMITCGLLMCIATAIWL